MGATVGKAPFDMPALKPYWGKPAVRNFRGDDGNVGIIRSPIRAIALPDNASVGSKMTCKPHLGVGAVRPSWAHARPTGQNANARQEAHLNEC